MSVVTPANRQSEKSVFLWYLEVFLRAKSLFIKL